MHLLFSLAIPALQPIVHDLFVLRGSNKADAGKELDTQKEVVVSMLLRLVQYHQVYLQPNAKRHGKLVASHSPDTLIYSLPVLLHVVVGVGNVHSCTAAVSQRE